MADDRMFLIHDETHIGVMIGKASGVVWHIEDCRLNEFYNHLISNGYGSDKFTLYSESNENGWEYADFIDGWWTFRQTGL